MEKKSEQVWRKSPLDMNFTDRDAITLSSQDKRDHHPLREVDGDTLRFRCALIQLLNRRMSRVSCCFCQFLFCFHYSSQSLPIVSFFSCTLLFFSFHFISLCTNKKKVMNWLDFDRARDQWSLGYRLQKTAHLFFGALKRDIFWEDIEKTWGSGLGMGPSKCKIPLDPTKHGMALISSSSSNQAPERSQNMLLQYVAVLLLFFFIYFLLLCSFLSFGYSDSFIFLILFILLFFQILQ